MNPISKGLAIAIIFLFIGLSVPSTGRIIFDDDITPPVTTHSLDPETPDGENGWYVSDVTVTLNATDGMSGVKEIKYTVDGAPGKITGNNGTFEIDMDGQEIEIEYWAIDNAGNIEEVNSFTIDMDQTKPEIDGVAYRLVKKNKIWYVEFFCKADDYVSGMERVEMFIYDELYEIKTGKGPHYNFTVEWSEELKTLDFIWFYYDKAGCYHREDFEGWLIPTYHDFFGMISNPIISDNDISFFAIFVIHKYWESTIPTSEIIMFKHLKCPVEYSGYIGRFFIIAQFY